MDIYEDFYEILDKIANVPRFILFGSIIIFSIIFINVKKNELLKFKIIKNILFKFSKILSSYCKINKSIKKNDNNKKKDNDEPDGKKKNDQPSKKKDDDKSDCKKILKQENNTIYIGVLKTDDYKQGL